jgi:hypothetical protein
MAKLSISVPDDLWNEAKALSEKGTPSSKVVQAALGEWVSQRRAAPLENAFEPDKPRLLEIAARLGAAYEEEFRRGYGDGLKVAEWAGFDALAVYIRLRDWDLVSDFAPGEQHVREDGTTEYVLPPGPVRDFWEGVGLEEGMPANDVYADGADRAFRDLWDALRAGEWRPQTSDAADGAE